MEVFNLGEGQFYNDKGEPFSEDLPGIVFKVCLEQHSFVVLVKKATYQLIQKFYKRRG